MSDTQSQEPRDQDAAPDAPEAASADAPQAGAPDDAAGLGDGSPALDAEGTEGAGDGPAGGQADVRRELDAARDRHLRLAAEFDNYRKRVERERGESFVRAQAQLVEKLLDPLDDLQRIADFDPATTAATALHEGAEMVERKFLRALEAAGLETVDAEGQPFDPNQHEAITVVATDAKDEDDTVADVFQKGYRFKGVLLRPARVRVKKYGG